MNQRPSFLKELERRNVFKVAVAYVISSWLLAQVADLVLDNFYAPDWSMRALLIALAVGFPIAMIISWVFEFTPGGVVPESDIDRTITIGDQSGKRLDRIIIAILAVVIIFMGLERFFFSARGGNEIARDVITSTPIRITEHPNEVLAAIRPNSVAVLPFAVLSTGPDDNYFADGLTEEIINALSQLPELMVTARTSAFHFKGQSVPIDEIAARLRVAHVVEGSVRRAGEQLRITAQLIRSEDGFHLWSETYDRRTEDTFAVQQDIAEKVATALNVLMDEEQRILMQNAGLRNVEAFTAYQKGLEFYAKAHETGADISLLRRGNEQFKLVSKLVPDFSQAYLQHADLFTHMLLSHASGQLDGNITEIDIETAPDALRHDFDQAVSNARNNSQRVIAEFDRALNLGDWRGLSALSERALLAPGCEVAVWAHLSSGPFGQAALMHDAYSRLAVCNPLENRATVHLSLSSLWAGQPEAGLKTAVNALKTQDHHALKWSEILAQILLNDFEAAEHALDSKTLSSDESLYARSFLAAAQADLDLASSYQQQYLQMHGSDDQTSLVMEAAMGNRTEANRLAGLIDRRSFGYLSLMQAIYSCMCGAPFDLTATPVFAEKLSESGLPWPPLSPINFPLKDW